MLSRLDRLSNRLDRLDEKRLRDHFRVISFNTKLGQIIAARRHYLGIRLPGRLKRRRYGVDHANLVSAYAKCKRITNRLRFLVKVTDSLNGKGKRMYLRLTSNQNARLLGLLKHAHNHCIRVPRDKKIPYLTPGDLGKLSRLLRG